jgi:hypothetical protein
MKSLLGFAIEDGLAAASLHHASPTWHSICSIESAFGKSTAFVSIVNKVLHTWCECCIFQSKGLGHTTAGAWVA